MLKGLFTAVLIVCAAVILTLLLRSIDTGTANIHKTDSAHIKHHSQFCNCDTLLLTPDTILIGGKAWLITDTDILILHK